MLLEPVENKTKHVYESTYVPRQPDIRKMKNCMHLDAMDYKKWLDNVSFNVFKDIFEPIVELCQMYVGGDYICGIKFGESKVLNFIFKGMKHYREDRFGMLMLKEEITLNIVLADDYLRDDPSLYEYVKRQLKVYKIKIANPKNNDADYDYITGIYESGFKCDLTLDKNDILKQMYDYMKKHKDRLVLQSTLLYRRLY